MTRRLCPVRFGWRGVSLAQQVVLAHPTKLRIITEGKRKRDPLDAQVLAEFLESDGWRTVPARGFATTAPGT